MADEPSAPSRGRWQKGQPSPNPKGRPPKGQHRKDAADVRPTSALVTRSANWQTRRDSWANEKSGHGTARDRRRLTRYNLDIVTDEEAKLLWATEFLCAAIIEDPAKEAFRRGWHVKCEDKDLDVAICKQAEELGLTKILINAGMKEDALGGSAIFPVLEGALDDLSQPLDESKIVKVHAFHVFEPIELTPHTWYSDINQPGFRRPETWRFTPLSSGGSYYARSGLVIHESRLIIFPGIQISTQTLPGQRLGWGYSALCRPWTVISDFGLAWGSAATLLANHGKGTLKLEEFADMLAEGDGGKKFDDYLNMVEQAWSALRMNVIGKEDEYVQSTGTLAGVADTLNEFKVLMAAAARRPVSILMGQSQSGLRTGNDDTINWHATVEGIRTLQWAHGHERAIKLLMLQTDGPTGGQEPESWAVEYHPLHTPSEKEIADTRKVDMDRAIEGIEYGVYSADDVAESFHGGDTYSGDIHINWERRQAQAAIDQQTQADMSPEDMAAMGQDQTGTDTGEPDDGASLDDMEAELNALEADLGPVDSGEEYVDVQGTGKEPADETGE